jgi:hypothetical protein
MNENLVEDIRKRIDPMPSDINLNMIAYQLWYDCRVLLATVDCLTKQLGDLERDLI